MAIQIAPSASTTTQAARKTLTRTRMTTANTRINQKSRIESIPNEVLMRIFTYVTLPSYPECSRLEMPSNTNDSTPKCHTNLHPCVLVSRHFYTTGIAILYRSLKFSSTTRLRLVHNVIHQKPELGRYVRSVDFSTLKFNTQALTPLLRLMPLLREIVIGNQDIETKLDRELWSCVLFELAHLENVSLQRCHVDFDSLNGLNSTRQSAGTTSKIQNLSITGQDLTKEDELESLLARQKHLKFLSLSKSSFSISSLMALPSTTRLETLNLRNSITGRDRSEITQLLNFLTTHPSTISSLTSLTLTSTNDFSTPEIHILPTDITHLLTHLPQSTLKHLNLKGLPLTTAHTTLLQRFPNLESLHTGPTFTIRDAETLILEETHTYAPSDLLFNPEHFTYEGLQDTSISPLCKAMFSTRLKMRLNTVVPLNSTRCAGAERKQRSKMRYLDVSDLTVREAVKIIDSVLWAEASRPLEVIEVNPKLVEWKEGLLKELVKSVGWKVRSVGRRSWVERREL